MTCFAECLVCFCVGVAFGGTCAIVGGMLGVRSAFKSAQWERDEARSALAWLKWQSKKENGNGTRDSAH